MLFCSRSRSHSRRAFTLIEILIVIAIIALLAAILFPAFSSAREMARRSTCQGNLKQIGMAFQQYTSDYDSVYPINISYFHMGSTLMSTTGWAQMVSPYLKSMQIFQCPTEPNEQNPYIKSMSETPAGINWVNYSDYFYNGNFTYGTQSSGVRTRGGVYESKLSAPSLTVLLGDGINFGPDNGSIHPSTSGNYRFTYNSLGNSISSVHQPSPMNLARHSGCANYAFADGHVKWLKYTAISSGFSGYSTFPGYSSWPENYHHHNAMPPGQLSAPSQATFAMFDY